MIEVNVFEAALGGSLIGLGAGLLWLSHQRVAGISGIAAGLLPPWNRELSWRLWFIAGLFISGVAYRLIADARITIDTPLPILVLSGLLVGYGSRLGGGCTSGHGICGIARLSIRSIVATLTFMLIAGIVVYVSHHLLPSL